MKYSGWMGPILALALAAAIYPQLLAVVVIILTRPSPRLLLWACYLGGLCLSIGSSLVILAVFRSRGSVAGTTSARIGPAAYTFIGVLAVLLALFAVTRRGRELLGSDLPRRLRRRRDEPRPPSRTRSRAENALKEGSLLVAVGVGLILGVPGPFDLVAIGHLARNHHSDGTALVAIIAFSLIKFLLIEVPIACYTLRPERTASEVARFAEWMKTRKLDMVAAVVGVIGLTLIGRGISGLA